MDVNLNKNENVDNLEFQNGEEVNVSERRHVILYVVVFTLLVVVSQLNYIFKYSFNETEDPVGYMNTDAIVSATEMINSGNNATKLSRLAKNQRTFIAEIDTFNNGQFLHVQSTYGNFKVPIYTLRDFDIDKGLIPKDYSYYPEIKVNVVGSLSTQGVLIETQQNSGYQTYSNKVYIRGNKVVDVGFQKRLTANDTTKYYDNAILIVDTLHINTKDFVRVYDDETGEILFSLNANETGLDRDYIDSLNYSAVSDHFITYSTKYKGKVTDGFTQFYDDGTFKNVSVWDNLDVSDAGIKSLKEYELNTNSDCITFVEYNDQNELVYKVKYIDNNSSESLVKIKLDFDKQ